MSQYKIIWIRTQTPWLRKKGNRVCTTNGSSAWSYSFLLEVDHIHFYWKLITFIFIGSWSYSFYWKLIQIIFIGECCIGSFRLNFIGSQMKSCNVRKILSCKIFIGLIIEENWLMCVWKWYKLKLKIVHFAASAEDKICSVFQSLINY